MRRNRIVFFILVLLMISTLISNGISWAALSPDKLLERIDQIRAPGKTFMFDVKITYKKDATEDVVQEFNVRVKEAEKSLVKFTYPPINKGRLLLMDGNNMWIYIPGSRGSIRISPQQRLLGQVSNGDVARVVYSLDYNPKLLGNESIDGQDCIKLELDAKTGQATYAKIVLWADSESIKPQKAEFYAVSGKLLKITYYKGYTQVLGEERPMRLEVDDELRKGEHTIMEYRNMQVVDTPNAYFQKDYLKHIQ